MFDEILTAINNSTGKNFNETCRNLESCVDSDKRFIHTLKQIGTIPENFAHDSTEEKLFSKASDMVLARAFRELGLKSTVLHERSDSADVIAESRLHGYTLVADAKSFRLTRNKGKRKYQSF